MIESNNSEINVDELMRKIREEVAKRQAAPRKRTPIQASIPSLNINISQIESLLKNAETRAYSRTKIPDKFKVFPFNLNARLEKVILKVFNVLFKDQREVNFNLIQALKECIVINQQLIEQIATLKSEINQISNTKENSFQEVSQRLNAVNSHVEVVNQRLNAFDSNIEAVDERLNIINHSFEAVDERLNTVSHNFEAVDERLNAVNNSFEKRLDAVSSNVNLLDVAYKELNERYIRNDSYLKNDLSQQKRLITLFLEEARQRFPESFSQEDLKNFENENKRSLDAFYFAFEDYFRGSREEIKNRLKVYIPFVKKAVTSTTDATIVDIGCGRGEWLELLSKEGYQPSGIDINYNMVQQCKELNLDAIEGDCLQHLHSLPDNSLTVISAFHVIEHLPLSDLITFIDEALRVLKTGGVAIIETPNPENLIVGACNFYLDLTHRNPIPPQITQYLLENRGFCQIEILRLHPMLEDHNLDNLFLKNLLLGCQDYAVIGWKP